MPAPLVPLAAKVILGGAALGFGSDLYEKGKAMLRKHGPAAVQSLGGISESITDVLDPLDIFGSRAKREAKKAAAAAAHEKKALKALSAKEEKKRKKEWAKAQKAIKALEAKAQKAIKAAEGKATKEHAAAAKALADLAALRAARAATAKAPEGHPGAELVNTVLASLVAGGAAPDAALYEQPQYGITPGLYAPPDEDETAELEAMLSGAEDEPEAAAAAPGGAYGALLRGGAR